MGQLLHASKIVADKEGIIDGFRVVINSGASACKFLSLSMHVSACLTVRCQQELKQKSFPMLIIGKDICTSSYIYD